MKYFELSLKGTRLNAFHLLSSLFVPVLEGCLLIDNNAEMRSTDFEKLKNC